MNAGLGNLAAVLFNQDLESVTLRGIAKKMYLLKNYKTLQQILHGSDSNYPIFATVIPCH